MTHLCANCGAGLFAGQQFCRRCGERTGGLEGEAPTRILADSPPAPAPAQGTTALPPRGTGENFWPPARPTEHHGPIGHASYTSPLPVAAAPERAKGRRRWLVPALLGLMLLACVGGIVGLVMMARAPFIRGFAERVQQPPPPPLPGPAVLDEAGATVTAGETIWTQTFEVSESAVFSLSNLQGDITVEGWDGSGVEVRMTKRGGTAEDRRAARVTLRQTDDLLAIASSEAGQIKVSYEVRVPRSLRRVELTSRSGDVKVSGLETPLAVNLTNGDIRLDDVRGPAQARLVNGDIEVVYRGEAREGPHEFKTVNGDVSLRLADGMEGPVKASVVNGEIEVDDRLGFNAQKKKPGWFVDARLDENGEGGEPLTAESVNGSIKFDR
jgi:hypothetical protein